MSWLQQTMEEQSAESRPRRLGLPRCCLGISCSLVAGVVRLAQKQGRLHRHLNAGCELRQESILACMLTMSNTYLRH